MSRDHAAFAAELRVDAAALRRMAEALELRAEGETRAHHDEVLTRSLTSMAVDQDPNFPSAFVMNMDEAQHQAWMQRIRRSEARHRFPIDEDNYAFGLRYVGSSLAPTLDYT